MIDKPAGMTSHDVVQRVKKILRVKKAGHTGTLDPLATGVLPVCANEATKLVPFLAEERKEYRVTMRLGVTTDTLDIEGTVLAQRDVAVEASEIERVLKGFTGNIEQRPPVIPPSSTEAGRCIDGPGQGSRWTPRRGL